MILEIKYPRGEMKINAKEFFPAKQKDAKILFNLAVRYCTREKIEELVKYLESEIQNLEEEIKECREFYQKTLFKKTETVLTKYRKNLTLLLKNM